MWLLRKPRSRPACARIALLLAASFAACNDPAPPPGVVPAGAASASGSSSAPGTAGSSSAAGSGAAPTSSPRVVQLAPPRRAVGVPEPRGAMPTRVSLQLVQPGTGKLAPLRYTLAAGTVSFRAQTRLATRHLEAGSFTQPNKLPPIRDGFAITIAADQPGRLALRALPGETAKSSADANAYLASWRALENRRMTVAIDDRGRLDAITFNDDPTGERSEAARHDLAQRLLATIVPLPDAPVGVGARWRVVTTLKQGPAFAKQTALYTLTAKTARLWKLHVRIQRVAEAQQLSDPSVPPGTSAELLAMFRVLEGDVEVDPRQPLISRGSFKVESRMHVKLTPAAPAAAAPTEQLFEDNGTITLSRQP